MHTPPFMAHLALDADADERAIKRAYAVRLKKIDQETDPEGFQRLREAYEAALQWAKSSAAEGATQPELASEALDASAPSAPQAHEAPNPEQLAGAVFDAFMAGLPDSALTLEGHLAALNKSLEDPRMVNLEARVVFEWLIARQLAEGWRPGHEVLLVAATDCFHWHTDRSRLAQFNRVGAMLDAALSERAVFDSQQPEMQEQYREVIRKMRLETHPGDDFLLKHLDRAELLASRLPNWLWIITRVESLKQWREWVQVLPESKREKARKVMAKASQPAPNKKTSIPWWAVMVMIMLISKLGSWSTSSSPSSRFTETSTPNLRWPPEPVDARPVSPDSIYGLPKTGGVSMERFDDKGSPHYKGLPETSVIPERRVRHATHADAPPPAPMPNRPSQVDKVISDFDPGKLMFDAKKPTQTGPGLGKDGE